MPRHLLQLGVLAFLLLLADQGSKFWAVGALTRAFEVEGAQTLAEKGRAYLVMRKLEPLRKEPLVVVKERAAFRYLENPGAAWGILGDLQEELRLPFFRFFPLFALAMVFYLYLRAGERQRLLRISLILVFGGALGNLSDRWIRGYVVDFIDLHWGERHFPTFNVADIAISLGMIGMLFEVLLAGRRAKRLAARGGEAGVEVEAEMEAEGNASGQKLCGEEEQPPAIVPPSERS